MIKKITLTAVILFLYFYSFAQNPDGISREVDKTMLKQKSHSATLNRTATAEDAKSIQFESILEKFEWENKQINFNPLGSGILAGDINGDGKDDLIRSYSDIFDVSTEDLSDRVNKSLIFLGSNTNKELPDQIINSFLYPVGDMNNDGFDDAIGVDFNNTISFFGGSSNGYVRLEQLPFQIKSEIIGFYDFNNDSFEDFLTRESGDKISSYSIIYGANSESNFRQIDYNTNNDNVFLRPVKQGNDILLYEFLFDEDKNLSFEAIEFAEESREATVRFNGSYSIANFIKSGSKIDIQSANINGDEYGDILINPINTDSRIFNNIIILNSADGPENQFTTLSSGGNWLPIGDYNNDGLDDFIRFLGSGAVIGYSSVIGEQFYIKGLFFFTENINVPRTRLGEQFKFGDLNGDGFSDLQFAIGNSIGSGNRIVYGNDSLFFENAQEVIYPANDYTILVNYLDSRTLNDLNGDNINDLALLYSDHLDIFLGGEEFSSTPDFTIETEEDVNNVEIASGDFNNDGLSDIAITTSKSLGFNQRDRQAVIYYGSESFDENSKKIINPFSISNTYAWSINAIGDINADGIEDFAIMTFQSGIVHVFLGGAEISNTADLQIDLQGTFGFNNIIDRGFGFGYRFNNVGDINGDGIDDLAVSDFSRSVISDDGSQVASSAGAIFVIYGEEFPRDNPAELIPSEVLIQKELALNERFRYFGWSVKGGDFNGDGTNDLIAVADESRLAENLDKGLEYIFIYHGGEDFDNIADQSFKLPSAPFNAEGEHVSLYLGEIIVIPDLDEDGDDELLVCTDVVNQNAVLFLGGQTGELVADAIFESPNKATSLGGNNNFFNLQYRSSLGDFNNDGRLEVILPQTEDRNFRNIPLYIFPVENPSKQSQSISFNQIDNKTVNDEPFELIATTTSGLPVTFELIDGPASLDGSTITLDGTVGTVTIKASQAGGVGFFAAEPVEQNFEVEIITSLQSHVESTIVTYPNPVKNMVSIRSSHQLTDDISSIQIRTLTGQMIREVDEYEYKGETISFSLANLKNGIYLIELQSASEKYLTRIIKQ